MQQLYLTPVVTIAIVSSRVLHLLRVCKGSSFRLEPVVHCFAFVSYKSIQDFKNLCQQPYLYMRERPTTMSLGLILTPPSTDHSPPPSHHPQPL